MDDGPKERYAIEKYSEIVMESWCSLWNATLLYIWKFL